MLKCLLSFSKELFHLIMLISVEMLAQFAVLCCENAVTLLLALAGRFCFGGGNASAVL